MSAHGEPSLPPALLSRNPLAWFALFGPGAIIASLTIGTGELIFSTRGGALFGYRILFLFVLISVLKWGLVFASARHMVLSGVHPYRRMLDLPGPRGWFPLLLFLLVAICMPIWTSFHSGVLGNFTSWLTGTRGSYNGAVDYLWGGALLAGVLVLSATGGYSVMERVQMAIVVALVLSAAVTLLLYHPDWLEMLKGALIPQRFEYPAWLFGKTQSEYVQIAAQPVWVETTRYVGVIGGAGFDYMAYTTWLRDKHWGLAAAGPGTAERLDEIARDSAHPVRAWIRAPLADCTLSFVVVVAFSAVFVASGVVVLGPNHEIPTDKNLLNLQAKFVTSIHPWLLPIYVAGAFLTMFGTLYGTIEIAHAILAEMVRTVHPDLASRHARRIKRIAIAWCAVGAYGALGWMFFYTYFGGADQPRVLMAIMTPVNLFTGVLGCGLFCLLLPWMDWRFLPRPLWMPAWLAGLNLLSAGIFLSLGVKGYWDNHNANGPWTANRWFAILAIVGVTGLSVVIAAVAGRGEVSRRRRERVSC